MQTRKNRIFHSEDIKIPADIRLETVSCPTLFIWFLLPSIHHHELSGLLLAGLHKESAGVTAALLLPQSQAPAAKTKQKLTRAF